jgi:type III pantothenate kinase
MRPFTIAIDLGNTAAKVGIFEGETLVKPAQRVEVAGLPALVEEMRPRHVIICSVSGDAAALRAQLMPVVPSVYVLDYLLPVPVANLYQSPQTLGMDRLAAVAGAAAMYPGQHCLVIDLGTCITYDLVDADGHYHGGAISPGLRMRFQAMHTFTARLPLIEPEAGAEIIGKTTRAAMQSGVVNGLLGEIEGMMARYGSRFFPLTTILCGGDALFFESQLKGIIFAVPELVLIGLNRILLHNVSLT